MSTVSTDLGKVCVTPKGAWSDSTAYEILDIVTNAGGAYLAKADVPAGMALTNTDYWIQIVEKGDKGNTGEISGASASISGGYGTPAVSVTSGGTSTDRSFAFAFSNLVGNGITGITLEKTDTEGLVDTYTMTITTDAGDETVTFDVTNGQDGEVTEESLAETLEEYAKIDGAYETMTVGNSEQLVSTVNIEDQTPYNFRTSGGSVDIGDREEDTIVGGTVAWNQQLKEMNSTNFGASSSSVTASFSNGVATVTSSVQYGGLINVSGNRPAIPNGHKVLCRVDVKLSSAVSDAIRAYWNEQNIFAIAEASTNWQTLSKIITWDSSKNNYARVNDFRSSDWDSYQVRNSQLFDLTQMFGSTIADYLYTLEQGTSGSGISKAKSWGYFLKDYYAHNAGGLMSVQTSEHKMVGFNQFNGTVNVGYKWDSGSYINNGSNIYAATPDKIRCIPNTTYCLTIPNITANTPMYLQEFDGNSNWIKSNPFNNVNGTSKRTTFTTGNDTYYISFFFYRDTVMAQTEFSEVNVNIHWDGERDGEYEEYKLRSYPLDSSLTLRGIPKLDANNNLYYDGDVYESGGTVTRKYGVYTFDGSEAWERTSYTLNGDTQYYFRLYSTNYTNKISNAYGGGLFTLSKPYDRRFALAYWYSGAFISDKIAWSVGTTGSAPGICIRDDAYTDIDTFKAHMSGTVYIYELATPTTESADPYQSPQIVDDFGTEEYVDYAESQGTRDVAIPVGHVTQYQPNLRAKLEMAPNSPDGDGDYIVRQTNGTNEYVQLVIPDELPDSPAEDGTYVLKATVSSGTVTLSWEAQS